MSKFRSERDSMGEVNVPQDALWGAQTQRAIDNFRIHGAPFPRVFIRALGLIKSSAAMANASLELLDKDIANAIIKAAGEVADGQHDAHFPVVIYQTGSGTSTNMNANEVIANRASQILGKPGAVHPNDHVNMGQSSNDVVPTAIHVSAYIQTMELLLPGLQTLKDTLDKRAKDAGDLVKTGRTHLMDAMPLKLSDEIGAWATQVQDGIRRIESSLPRIAQLALGGTAVGTGINAHPEFAKMTISIIAERTGHPFVETTDHFAAQASMDNAAELSSQIKATASGLMKIADDLRWLNSGPIAGLSEIALPSLQPGSSIMPGKINPVICEAMMMVAAQVMGNDLTVSVSNSRGNFQLNVMLPVIAYNLLESITLMGSACEVFAKKAIDGFTINKDRIGGLVSRNPILVTALNPVIGYDLAAKIAKRAYAEGRPVKEVAAEMTDLSDADLDKYLDPKNAAKGNTE